MWCGNQPIHHFEKKPQVCVLPSTCEDKVAIALDTSLHIYDKESLQPLFTLNLESDIDYMTWTDNSGRFLLVADRSGLLHSLHMRSQRVINSERIFQSSTVGSAFNQLLVVQEYSYLFVLGSEELHCFSHMDYPALDEALCSGAMAKAAALREEITHKVTVLPHNSSSIIADLYDDFSALYLLGSESCLLTKLEYEDDEWVVDVEVPLYGFGNAEVGFNVTPHYLLTKTDKGVLMLWHKNCTMINVWPEHKLDSIAILTSPTNRLEDCKVIVSGRLHGREGDAVSILSLPDMHSVYSQPADGIHLAHHYTGHLFLPYIGGLNTPDVYLTSIALISSQARCEMMLSKKLFPEALTFAKDNRLDVQVVYEAWAFSLSETLSDCLDSLLDFKSCLEKLTNLHLVADICLAFISSTGTAAVGSALAEVITAVLKYALTRLEVPSHAKCHCDRITQVLRSLQRLSTYIRACGTQGFSCEGWKDFLTCDLKVEVLRLAKNQSVSAAMAIWSAHKAELKRSMAVEWLSELLGCLNTTLDHVTLEKWLRADMVPVIDSLEQVALSEQLARHVERLARDYELSDKGSWPDNSLVLCSVFDECDSPLISASLNRLMYLKDNLKCIKELKDIYHCPLSYAVYCEQTRESIVHRLLDVVAVPSMFKQRFDAVIGPYMTQYCIHSDKNLLMYVKDLISRYKHHRGYDRCGLLWEQKAVKVVECMRVASYQVNAVMELAKHCHTPWSQCIEDIVDWACMLSCKGVEELAVTRKKSLLSQLLSSYEVPKEVIPSPGNVMMIIKYILKKNGASLSGLEHALQVGRAFKVEDVTVYVQACQARLRNMEDVSDIISVSGDAAGQVERKLVSQCVQFFTDLDTAEWGFKAHLADIAINILGKHSTNLDAQYFHMPLDRLSSKLKSLLLLKREFDVEMTLKDLESEKRGLSHLRTLIGSLVGENRETAAVDILENGMWRLELFSHHAGIAKSALYGVVCSLACEAASSRVVAMLELIARRDNSSSGVRFIISKLKEMVSHNGCEMSKCKQLLRLASHCVTHCAVDDLLDANNLLSLLRYHHDVMANCLGGDDTQDMTSDQEKVELSRKFTRKYHSERDLLVDTPLVSELTNKWMCSVLASQHASQSSSSAVIEGHDSYHQLLVSNSHEMLSIKMSLLLYYRCSRGAIDSQVTNYLSNKLKTSVTSLLNKLLAQRNLDVHQTLAALLDLPANASLSLVKQNAATSGPQFLRIMCLANIALVLCATSTRHDYLEKCKSLKKESIWGYVLAKHGVQYLSVFGKATKGQLLPQIAGNCPLQVLDKYISDFELGCDSERTHLTKVQSLIARHCDSHFWHSSKEGPTLLAEIKSILARMSLQEEIVDSLVESCNPYNYALIQVVQTAYTDTADKKRKLLDLLFLYQRQTAPSTWEVNFYKDMYLDKGDNSLPPISDSRLPYHPLLGSSLWKVLRPELSAKSFKVLRPIVTLLKIKTDVFQLNTAVQIAETHIGQRYKGDSKAASDWCTDDSVDSIFVDDITVVLADIQDKQSAVMCCQTLINKLPAGTEKVLITKICADMAKSWKGTTEQGSDEYKVADGVVRKVRSLLANLSVEQTLHQHNLVTEHLLALINQPRHLIQAILETTHNDSSHRAGEKFEACCCIADITGRDIARVCSDIIGESWLCVGAEETQAKVDMDMTMTLDMAAMMSSTDQTSANESPEENGCREKWIVHLVQSHIGLKIIHLLNSVLNNISSTHKCRLFVIRCFLLLGDAPMELRGPSPSHHIQLTNKQLRQEYKALRYIERLRSLNINMTVEQFYACDMNSLLTRLCKNYTDNPLAVGLCADLCVQTSNYSLPLLKSMMQQMIHLYEIDGLAKLLSTTSDQSEIWHLDIYKQAWQLVYNASNSNRACLAALSSCPITDRLRK